MTTARAYSALAISADTRRSGPTLRSAAQAQGGASHPELRSEESANLESGAWFASLSPALRKAMLARAVVRHVNKGAMLVCSGDMASDWIGVASGALRLSQDWKEGASFTLQFLGPGDWYGDVDLVDPAPAMVAVQAHTRSTLLILPRRSLHELMSESDELRSALLQMNCRRLRWLLRRIEGLKTPALLPRVAAQLQRLSQQFGRPTLGGIHIEVPLTQSDMADLLCASRQRVNLVFRRLQMLGVIRTRHTTITIIDPDRLGAVADGRQVSQPLR